MHTVNRIAYILYPLDLVYQQELTMLRQLYLLEGPRLYQLLASGGCYGFVFLSPILIHFDVQLRH